MAGFKVCTGRATKKAGTKCIIVRVDDPADGMEEHISAGDDLLIPVSQIDDDSEVYEVGHEGELVITEWLAGQREWTES